MSVKYTVYNVFGDVLGYYLEAKEHPNGIHECSNEEFTEMTRTVKAFTDLQAKLLDQFDKQFTKPDEDEKT